jgi:putative tryptophan/tyrosine transport system substrate-binding protein
VLLCNVRQRAAGRPFRQHRAFVTARRVQLATLAARHMVPTTSGNREITETGGLMSYGANIAGAYHQMGVYVGRILKGEKPADLPVMQ